MDKDKKPKGKKIDSDKKKKDIKKEEHKVNIDTKETVEQNDDELTNRINRLYGISSEPIKEEKQYDPKELEEVRKKLVLLLMGVIICGVVILIILVNPFDFGNKNNLSENLTENPNEEVEKEEEKNDEIPLGDISLSNSTVNGLNNLVTFTVEDFMAIDLFPLYANDTIEINTIPNNIKLYLLKKNNKFVELLETVKIEEYIQTCSASGLVVSKEAFDNTFMKVFGQNTTVEYNNIDYTYYSNNLGAKKITLSYENDRYVVRCNDYVTNETLTKLIQQKLSKAVKTETSIEIYQNVVFINQTGVYKDTNFSQLITNDTNAELADYISKGALYKYTFTENNGSYYLSRIEKVKETSN